MDLEFITFTFLFSFGRHGSFEVPSLLHLDPSVKK